MADIKKIKWGTQESQIDDIVAKAVYNGNYIATPPTLTHDDTLVTTTQMINFISVSSTDTTIAYQKSVPAGVLKYASIDKIGGMSYKSENLLNSNNIVKGNIDTNGAVIGSSIRCYIFIDVKPNTYYSISITNKSKFIGFRTGVHTYNGNTQISDNGWVQGNNTFLTENNCNKIGIIFTFSEWHETVVTNLTEVSSLDLSDVINANIMIVKSQTPATTYQPYFTDIRDSAVTSIVSDGANLINVSDNTISSAGYLINTPISNLGIGTYTISFNWTGGGSIQFRALKNDVNIGSITINNTISGINSLTITTTDIPDTIYLYSNNSNGGTVSNIMLTKGSTAQTYIPYIAPITKQIPAEIQALNGYGWGINSSVYNYIDFENKKYIQKVGRIDLGSLTYTYESAYATFKTTISDIKLNNTSNISCSKYSTTSATTWDNIQNMEIGKLGTNSTTVMIKDTSFGSNVAAFKNANIGVYLYYELETPVETDISSYIDDTYIDVKPNGTLTFNNTYEQDVPSEVTYYSMNFSIDSDDVINALGYTPLDKSKITYDSTTDTLTIDLD